MEYKLKFHTAIENGGKKLKIILELKSITYYFIDLGYNEVFS